MSGGGRQWSEAARAARRRKTKPLAERFWPHVVKGEACWTWVGASVASNTSVGGPGYGTLYFEGRNRLAHRLSWQLAFGPIPRGMFVLHRCDNPPCVRPEHLFLGTHSDNMLDMWAKGRGKPSCNRSNAKITVEKARELRFLYKAGARTADLSERFGLHQTQVQKILRGVNWKEADGDGRIVKPSAKINQEVADEIRRLRAGGASARGLARQFHIHHTQVSRIARGLHWKQSAILAEATEPSPGEGR